MVKLRIRLRVLGAKNHRTYRVVVAESTVKRDGKYIALAGFYDPRHKDESRQLFINDDVLSLWISRGAKMTDSVDSLVKRWNKRKTASE
ncbi:MAG: 30S ribosomal protein S16 [Chlamydiia bacterium]|nr:30S ribosomal protein S16 [Chlamydiia bacterium]